MDKAFLGFELGTSARVLVVSVVTVLLLAGVMAVARRRQSYWWVSIALLAAGYAGLALASFVAVGILKSAFAGMALQGGGIATVRFSIWRATEPVLVAAWMTVVITLLAGTFLWRGVPKPLAAAVASPPRASTFAFLAVLALAVGVAPVLVARRTITLILWAISPRAHMGSIKPTLIPQAIDSRLLLTATVSVCCFLMLAAILVVTILLARRSCASRGVFAITAVALVASLGLSTVLAAKIHTFSNRYRTGALRGGIIPE